MAEDTSGDIVLCEPAQSKRTWTFHKSKFVWNFTGKMLDTYPRASVFLRACAVEMYMDTSQKPFCMENYKENGEHLSRGLCFVRACAVELHMGI